MKKLFISFSVLLNVSFLVVACSKMDAPAPESSVVNLSANTAAMRGGNSLTAISGGCNDIYHGLRLSDVAAMINNYGANQARVINGAMGIDDARSCWFSVADIKNFICHLESSVLQNSCLNSDSLGIRFYYGAHSNPPIFAGLPANYAKLHNLIMIPTYKSKGTDIDFNPYQVNIQTCTPAPLGLMEPIKAKGTIIVNSDADGDGFSMDHGQLFPPYNNH